jgi:mitogen-activated protein kinase kinase
MSPIMSDSPLSLPRQPPKSKPIPSLSSSSTTSSPSAFGSAKSSISRKKPAGLDISASIKPTRPAPGLPGSNPLGGPSDPLDDLSEAEKLRQDIERLQLSSASSSSHSVMDSPPTSPATGPGTPVPGAVGVEGSGSASGSLSLSGPSGSTSLKKKSASSVGGKKKSKTDKDGLELVKNEDLDILEDLGAGNGGTVTKVWNRKRNCVMARKVSGSSDQDRRTVYLFLG